MDASQHAPPSAAQRVDQFVELVEDRLHLGLGRWLTDEGAEQFDAVAVIVAGAGDNAIDVNESFC